jgi:thiamine-monophosphate kinase
MQRLHHIGELGWIERIRRFATSDRSVLKGIGDDCAVVRTGGKRLILFACDMLVEGVHFLSDAPAALVGWKALAVNVSDIAAMGGIPRWAVVSVGLPPSTPVAYGLDLYRGLARCARRFGVHLVGGDTNRAKQKVIDVAIVGEVEPDRVVYRSKAAPGDRLLVTGRLGGAVRSGRHLTFLPRLYEARAIGAYVKPHAMIDLSDGLWNDLMRLCQASGVSAIVEWNRLPLHRGSSHLDALTEGEDFELLMAVEASQAERLLRWAARRLPCGLHRIGEVIPLRGKWPQIVLKTPDGKKLPKRLLGFQHF